MRKLFFILILLFPCSLLCGQTTEETIPFSLDEIVEHSIDLSTPKYRESISFKIYYDPWNTGDLEEIDYAAICSFTRYYDDISVSTAPVLKWELTETGELFIKYRDTPIHIKKIKLVKLSNGNYQLHAYRNDEKVIYSYK